MLELDLLLTEFFDTAYPSLDPSVRQRFLRLLEQPDQTLQRWLLGEGSDVDPELQQIVQIMRKQGLERL
jgi:succinate dehydrogenase flavin-adding protein (antitoxin of CptAB toxin-antitoxin module)